MGRKRNHKLAEFVEGLVDVGSAEMQRLLGLPADRCHAVMREVAHGICKRFAKTYVFVPGDEEFIRRIRDDEIWRQFGQDGPGPRGARKFTADRVHELAQQHGLSHIQIYNILRAIQDEEIATRQGSLPGIEPADG